MAINISINMAINLTDHVAAAPPPTAAARGAVLAALDDNDANLQVLELDAAFASTSTLLKSRPGGETGKATRLGGFLQRSPGGEHSADVVAGALSRQEHATVLTYANTLAATWDALAAAGHVQQARVPDRAPYQTYYMTLGKAGIDPVTCGLTATPALTGLGAVGDALRKLASYTFDVDDPRPAQGESVYIFEVTKAKAASGTVSFAPSELTWHAGLRVATPMDSTLYLTAKGDDGEHLPQRPTKPSRAPRISPSAEGVRLTLCFDGTIVSVLQRREADGLEVGFEQRASTQVKERAALAQSIALECAKSANARTPDSAVSIGWTGFDVPKPPKPAAAGVSGFFANLNST
eukprot:gene39686-38307_t